ncbi:MAG: gliding motility-associated ABC transporter permease subunit GldF [Paludibacteraceae bacterium]|nr:gliding motility-associated ABC transporter permease subunit GldF [Paludibacteraceae bacterium]HOI26759.1 gliding motility-associated ABC transporter permease subunit GldF [Paludibacteraceae bacterium]HOU68839.1 gliding motility-associated ABC transporter permease subunit GldF [Paludibacteraceae bacterium]HPH62680.1 gliding motility-associated ABC transporter permease subunit GldF [Paludibacteraceae bacterium]HQF50737.1 gliding motility-associated ABC transporter permease subunit GldF [Palud
MLVLLKKEFGNFFASPMGYIVIGVFLVLTSLFLWVFPGEYNILDSGYANMDGLFILAPWLYLFLVPAVTMRLFAEEKRTGTIELLFTRPITKLSIVLSKYFAGVLLVLFSLAPTLIYFISVYLMGDPIGVMDVGGTWGSYIGLFFLAAIYVAIGLFASSLTDNQIISFIISAVLCFLFYYGFDLMSSMALSGTNETFISSLGINSHYESMSRGVIDSRDVIYYLVVITIFVFATKEVLDRKK